MHPPIRYPGDGLNDEASIAAGLDCSDRPDTARQEFKDEADINKILQKYGLNAPQKPVNWATVDYDLDLASAMISVHKAREAHANLPATLKGKYPTWQSLLTGAENGTLKLDLQAENAKTQAPPTPPKESNAT